MSAAAQIVRLSDLDDPAVAVYRNLKDREVALAGDRFIAEGEMVVRRLLASGWQVESLLVAETKLERVAELVARPAVIYVGPAKLVNSVIGFKFHSGIMACGVRPASPTVDEVMTAAAERGGPVTWVVCPQVLNHDNLGSLLRVAAGFGATAMLLGERCSDPFWRRSIRVSMGAIFALPIVRSGDLGADLRRLKERWGVRLIATVTDEDALPLARVARLGKVTRDKYPPAEPGAEPEAMYPPAEPGAELMAISRVEEPDRLALLLGPEDQGLEQRWVELCDQKVTIPMSLGTDSLNVTVAAAVFLYHFTQEGGSGIRD
ncbi:MAG: RNA methyltransferase [Phycisphaeraceae bacterium]|nr:RNA methyltransferase [Phycisphaeraceae bacterium]